MKSKARPKTLSDQFTAQRHDVLNRLQKNWGTSRRSADGGEKQRENSLEHFLLPFLEIADFGEDATAPLSRDPTEGHLRQMSENFKALKREKVHPLQEPPVEGAPPDSAAGSKRREQMMEIASSHFRNSMGAWMSSVAPDHEVTDTPLEELETLHSEAAYRLKVLTTMISMMEHQVDVLHSQIRARKIINERAARADAGSF